MAIRIYVSTIPAVPFDESWELVGTLESREPTINNEAAKKLRKNSGGSARFSLEFYLSGDPASRWVNAEGDHDSFAIAFDLLGDGSRVLVAQNPAKVTLLNGRPPEPHPGSVIRPIMIPIKVKGSLKRI